MSAHYLVQMQSLFWHVAALLRRRGFCFGFASRECACGGDFAHGLRGKAASHGLWGEAASHVAWAAAGRRRARACSPHLPAQNYMSRCKMNDKSMNPRHLQVLVPPSDGLHVKLHILAAGDHIRHFLVELMEVVEVELEVVQGARMTQEDEGRAARAA